MVRILVIVMLMVCGGCHLAQAVGRDLQSGSKALGELIADAGDGLGGDPFNDLDDDDY